jgi:hypothetical protein
MNEKGIKSFIKMVDMWGWGMVYWVGYVLRGL